MTDIIFSSYDQGTILCLIHRGGPVFYRSRNKEAKNPFCRVLCIYRSRVCIIFWIDTTRYSWIVTFHNPLHRALSKLKRVLRAKDRSKRYLRVLRFCIAREVFAVASIPCNSSCRILRCMLRGPLLLVHCGLKEQEE